MDPRAPVPHPRLEPGDLPADPLAAFRGWYEGAEAGGVPHPSAMALATATPEGRPSLRMVLLKDVDEGGGFVFFTNLESRKARELAANPRAALLFHWPEPHRQIRVEGAVTRASDAVADAYFLTRPVGSRVSAIVSPQSRVVPDREWLERRARELTADPAHPERTRPRHWGGYRLVADAFEFWQAGAHRLHDRVAYLRIDGGWEKVRLAP